MTLCVIDGGHCLCQPDEGVYCVNAKTDADRRKVDAFYKRLGVTMTYCVWDDCDQEAIYCEGHAREYADGLRGFPGAAPPAQAELSDEQCRDAIAIAKLALPHDEAEREAAYSFVRAGYRAARPAVGGEPVAWQAVWDAIEYPRSQHTYVAQNHEVERERATKYARTMVKLTVEYINRTRESPIPIDGLDKPQQDNGERAWPFMRSPGAVAASIDEAREHFGNTLAALRYVVIEHAEPLYTAGVTSASPERQTDETGKAGSDGAIAVLAMLASVTIPADVAEHTGGVTADDEECAMCGDSFESRGEGTLCDLCAQGFAEQLIPLVEAARAAPLTRVDAAVPSPIQAERHDKDEIKGVVWDGPEVHVESLELAAALPQEAAPSATWTNAEIHAVLDASALDVAALVKEAHEAYANADAFHPEDIAGLCRRIASALEREHARAEEAERERDNSRALVRDICEEWNEPCDCNERGVSRFAGHDGECKATNIAAAKRALSAKVAALEARLIRVIGAADHMANMYESLGRETKSAAPYSARAYRAARDAP